MLFANSYLEKGIEVVNTNVRSGKFTRGYDLTPGSVLTFEMGGLLEAFKATLDLLPEERKCKS
jgi:hypothetical protein